jgi:hypothetical protein
MCLRSPPSLPPAQAEQLGKAQLRLEGDLAAAWGHADKLTALAGAIMHQQARVVVWCGPRTNHHSHASNACWQGALHLICLRNCA